MIRHRHLALLTLILLSPLAAFPANSGDSSQKSASKSTPHGTYQQSEILEQAEAFFGKGAKGLGTVIEKAFKEHGEPNGYIKGSEAGGAIGVGLRYGHGELQLHGGGASSVYWQGPSIGFDFGGNAAKVFVLIYKLNSTDKLFQRFPGVEGSLYFVGGVGMRYLHADGITLAPVQLGVGWRQGASVGYMNFSRKKRIVPF